MLIFKMFIFISSNFDRFMSISRNKCPVPFDQQPLNEYLELKKSWLFAWSIYELKDYNFTVIIIFLLLFIIFGVFLIYFLFHQLNLYKILVIDCLMASMILLFFFIRLYLGWSYVVKRLLSATIFYEESGWYDGQIWIKSSALLTQDRLVGLYQIVPCLVRIKYTCLVLSMIFLFDYLLYRLF